ncbi:MAG: cyclic nucleotide-binding domain-containing protein [Methylococcaceae bacterium]|jgi:CRP-like cAMP-binding protein
MLPTASIPANTVIFSEGSYDKIMYIVIEGGVEIYVDRNGEEFTLATILQYDFFGEMAIYRNRPRSASAKTISDTKLVLIKSRVQLEQFIVENPSFAGKMMVIMGNRLANTNDLLIEKMNEYNARITELTAYSGDSDVINSTTV